LTLLLCKTAEGLATLGFAAGPPSHRLPIGTFAVTFGTNLLSSTGLDEPTRGFLRSFEKLSVSESIADEALRLMTGRVGLALPHALTWASANVNQLVYVTTDARWVTKADSNVVVPFRRSMCPAAQPVMTMLS
jgi:hypothetical protein